MINRQLKMKYHMTRRIFSTLLLLSLYNKAQHTASKTIPVLAVDSLYIHSVILSQCFQEADSFH